ncbi:hypothetical protein QBC38DRAFT_88059 [Podospora fimiseda]|uniref:Uncharacterized protein n=1 Tax=Podospora fimiseda TaxID=252190 RepID=A0AAN6YNA3_9PEZI|nr:hypothetical protein QBC38DRAFT_88059 [Podospora fimiseda]
MVACPWPVNQSHRSTSSAGDEKNRPQKPTELAEPIPIRPAPERSDSFLPPHLRASATNVQVMPDIFQDTYKTSDPERGLNDYFSRQAIDHWIACSPALDSTHQQEQSFETKIAIGAQEGKDWLKRLELAAMGRRESLSDIRVISPDLALSGNIISATFNIPHSLKYRKGADWELTPRRGQSVLFDSFSYLSSDEAPWNHTVVAWTGEIEIPPDALSPPSTPPTTTVHLSALNHLSKPVPIDGDSAPPTPPLVDGLWIPKYDMLRLENQLSHNKRIKTVPVWLADDTDGHDDGIRLKGQARWRRYAEHDLYTLFHYKQHEPSDGRAHCISQTSRP